MYEYRTTMHYGQQPPSVLTPPEPDFRLRDIRAVVTSASDTFTIDRGVSSLSIGVVSIPCQTANLRSYGVAWLIVWERFTPKNKENE